jgi:beta-glucosidase/6-phospho-beta-glucosidase/beta-galactosidase
MPRLRLLRQPLEPFFFTPSVRCVRTFCPAPPQLFRLGVDWGRIVPNLPTREGGSVPDAAALARYREILQARPQHARTHAHAPSPLAHALLLHASALPPQMVRARGMTVMLTLFHHSMPKWGGAYGGWTHPVCVEHFAQFASIVVEHLGDLVDYWVPFNEPTVFVGLTYCAGAWPPGFTEPGPLTSGVCMMAPMVGNYSRAMASVALAHRAAARAIRTKYTAPIGCVALRGAVLHTRVHTRKHTAHTHT